MRIFVSEFLTSGGWPHEAMPPSLMREGLSMLSALIADLKRIPGCEVTATWDARLGECPLAGVHVRICHSVDEEQNRFQQFASDADGTIVIAPEFHDLLLRRCEIVEQAGGTLIGCSSAAVRLCADKLALAQRCQAVGIATPVTFPFDSETDSADLPIPAVVKPRFGAGSQQTYFCGHRDDLRRLQRELRKSCSELLEFGPLIGQPYVRGRSFSVAALVAPAKAPASSAIDHSPVPMCEVWPIAEQLLSDEGRFHYRGGRLPIDGATLDHQAVDRLVQRVCESIPGLRGYVGFDFIWSNEEPQAVLMEINPRLTTGYLGYRALTTDNLAGRMLFAGWNSVCLPFEVPSGNEAQNISCRETVGNREEWENLAETVPRRGAAVSWQQTPLRYFPDGRISNRF